jgi:hypothetical protein
MSTHLQVIRLTKTGPTAPVTAGQAFTFELRAKFESPGPFTAVSIADGLPVGLLPGAANATWVANNTAAGGLNGCELHMCFWCHERTVLPLRCNLSVSCMHTAVQERRSRLQVSHML